MEHALNLNQQRRLVENIPAKVVLPPSYRCQELDAMESITHAQGSNASTRKSIRTSRSSSEHASDQIRGFHYDPRRAALGRDYLRRRWLPREGPLFYAFIQVMRSHCYYNPQTGGSVAKRLMKLVNSAVFEPVEEFRA